MTVTVYTAPACGGCIATKRHLKSRCLAHDEQPLHTSPDVAAIMAAHPELGTAPIVRAVLDDGSEQVWDGYRPDRIDALVG